MLLEVARIHDQSGKMLAEDRVLNNLLKSLTAKRVLEEESTWYQIRCSSRRKLCRDKPDGFE